MALPLLWHLPISHFSEKVRWALDWKRVPHRRRVMPPGLHPLGGLLLTGGQGYTMPLPSCDGPGGGGSASILEGLRGGGSGPPALFSGGAGAGAPPTGDVG